MANPVKLGIVDRAPGPNSSQREWSEWASSVKDVIEQLKFGLQGVTGNPSVNLQASTTPGAGSGTPSGGSVTSVSANGGPDVTGDINLKDGNGVDVTQSGQNFTLAADLTDLGATFLRRDGSNTMDGDITFSIAGDGPVIVINDGVADRKWRITGVWNASVSRPMLRLVEVV